MTQSVSEKSQSKITLSMPVQFLKGVGPARAKAFAHLGVHTVEDLLEHYPRDWNFAPELIKINQMQPDRTAAVIGLVESIDYRNYRRPPVFEVELSDVRCPPDGGVEIAGLGPGTEALDEWRVAATQPVDHQLG